MKVKDIMSGKLVSIAPEESAAVAARLLSRHNIGALPVCNKEGKLRGLVTDRDIVLRCVAAEDDPAGVHVSEIMTRRVLSVGANDSLKTVADLMAREQVRRLPVEENGRLVGMISLADLARLPEHSTEAAEALSEISLNMKRL